MQTPDPEESNVLRISGLVRSVGAAFVLRAVGAGLAFLLNVAIGRLLGASGAGLYFLSLSVVSVASVVARLGLENTVLRFVASFREEGDWARVRGVLRYALFKVGAVSIGLTGLIVLTAGWFETAVFEAEGLAPVLMAAALSVLGYNLMTLCSEALKGLSLTPKAMLVGGVLYPLVALVVVYPAILFYGATGAGLAYSLGTLAATGAGLLLWNRALSGTAPPAAVDHAEMQASSRPLWVSMIVIRAIQPWAPMFLLGIWALPSDAGVFGAATRIALLVSFFLIAINTVIAPRFAALHKRGQIAQIALLSRKFALLVTMVASPVFLVSIIAGDWVMSAFGPSFATAGHILAILSFGQLVNALTGPVGVILMMGGQERDMRTMSLISVVMVLVLAVLLIPQHGATGAAIATTTGSVLTSVLAVAMVRGRFGVWAVPFFPSPSRQKL